MARDTKVRQVQTIWLDEQRVSYRVVASRSAGRMRARVGPRGVEVIRPVERPDSDVVSFLEARSSWVLEQIQRAERLRQVRLPVRCLAGQMLFRGASMTIRIEGSGTRARGNIVAIEDQDLVVRVGENSTTSPARSLELWLRRQARTAIEALVVEVASRIRQSPRQVYVMGQRTKWGNCSSRRNLSFNWRLILAPDFVMRYLVTHELVHLAIPDHSAKFWLTVRGLCPETEKAKQWLCSQASELNIDLESVCSIRQIAGKPASYLRGEGAGCGG